MSQVLVTGGTGTLGRHVMPRLLEAGCSVRVLSRHSGAPQVGVVYMNGDLSTGEGVAAAAQGAEIILHLAGSNKGDEIKTQNLIHALKASGANVRNLVYISVVGADRVPVVSGIDRAMFGYFAAKRASEQLVMESGMPWTILRATQFHELVFGVAQASAKLPVVPVLAGISFQPVAADEVGARLAQLTLAAPSGLAPEFGGPRIYPMSELVREYLQANHLRRPMMPIWQPGQAARAHRQGANLTPDHAVGVQTWEQFLAERLGAPVAIPA